MRLKQLLVSLTICTLVPLQHGAEQLDAWTRADCVMECEVVNLKLTGLQYSAELMSHYDGIVRSTSVSLTDGRALTVGDIIPCAMVSNRLIPIKGYDTELYQRVSAYKIEPLTVPAVVGVKVVKRG